MYDCGYAQLADTIKNTCNDLCFDLAWLNPKSNLHFGDEVPSFVCKFLKMASVSLCDVGGLAPFDCSETAGISARFERWFGPLSCLQFKRKASRTSKRGRLCCCIPLV